MIVLCCPVSAPAAPLSTSLHPATEAALRRYTPPEMLKIVDVGERTTGYYDAIARYWTGEQDLVIIEHDIEITAETLLSFARCQQPWCSFGYELREVGGDAYLTSSLGCVRFSAGLQQSMPVEALTGSHHWRGLDHEFMAALWQRNYTAHVHGYVKHHHYQHCRKLNCQSCIVIHNRKNPGA